MATPTFYTLVTYYPNGLTGPSTQAYVPWITSFDQIDPKADLAVLVNKLGNYDPGLYVRNVGPTLNPIWELGLTYAVLTSNVFAQLNVVLRSNSNSAYTNYTVYKNSFLQSSGQITNDPNPVWVSIAPSGGGGGGGGTVAFSAISQSPSGMPTPQPSDPRIPLTQAGTAAGTLNAVPLVSVGGAVLGLLINGTNQ